MRNEVKKYRSGGISPLVEQGEHGEYRVETGAMRVVGVRTVVCHSDRENPEGRNCVAPAERE